MANLLVQASSKEDLLAGLYGLTAPLARLGFPRERFAVRAALTLDYATRLREGSPEPGAEAVACEGSRVSRLEARLQRRYSEAVARARSTTAKSIDLPAPAPAGAGDYLLVGLLALAVLVW
jgi:energy-coupling factor transport system permease protein